MSWINRAKAVFSLGGSESGFGSLVNRGRVGGRGGAEWKRMVVAKV